MSSESPVAKTRPGLLVSWREHTAAIMQLRRRIYYLLASHIVPVFHRNLPSKSLKVFKLPTPRSRQILRPRQLRDNVLRQLAETMTRRC